jgi:hypothetical protein
LADGSSTANGKNLYIKLVGTLSGNCNLEMPASTTGGNANRVFFIEDGTTRGGAGDSLEIVGQFHYLLQDKVHQLMYPFLKVHQC